MASDAPTHACTRCNGTGYKYGYSALGHGEPDCDWCGGLGSIFSDIVFRGHPTFEGHTDVIEGCCPKHLAIQHEGHSLLFRRESSPIPPYWFTKEDGKQVYRFAAVIELPVQLPTA